MFFSRHLLGLSIVLSLTLSSPFVFAEEESELDNELADYYGDEDFVSIATGTKQLIHKAPSTATVFTADDIKRLGASNLDDILEAVPGLHVSPSSLSRMSPVYSMRGIHSGINPQVLLLMNGTPFQHLATGGRPTLFYLPVENIHRVEVIRGPGSAVYGADAYSGVINVITKGKEQGDALGAKIGSFDSFDVWFRKYARLGDWDLSISFEAFSTKGDRKRIAEADLQTLLDTVFATNASLAPGPLNTNNEIFNSHIEMKNESFDIKLWLWNQNEVGTGSGGAQTLDTKGFQDAEQLLLDINYSFGKLIQDWKVDLHFSHKYLNDDSNFVLFPAGTVLPIGSDGNLNLTSPVGFSYFSEGYIGNPKGIDKATRVEFTGYSQSLQDHQLRLNVGFNNQKLETREFKNFGPGVIDGTQPIVSGVLTDVSDTEFVFMPDVQRDVWFLSIQDEWQLAKDWNFTIGTRYDSYSDFGSTFNPRVSLVWASSLNLTTKFLYGSAFRAPSFQELYIQNNPVSIGNTDLKPETIDTYEVVFNYRTQTFGFYALSIFNYQAKDLIEFIPEIASGNSVAQNARDQDGHGFELEGEWNFGKNLRIKSNYAWQQSKDTLTHQPIAEAPQKLFFLQSIWNVTDEIIFDSKINVVMDRERKNGDLREAIENYTLLDIGITYNGFGRNIETVIRVNNLLDDDAFDPSDGFITNDFKKMGRNIWAEISYGF